MAKSRDAAKEQYWRRVIGRFEASGLGVRRFCEREGLFEHRLHWWRRRLREHDRDQARHSGSSGTGKPVRAKAGTPVRGKAGKPVRAKAGTPVRGKAGGPVRGKAGGPVRGKAGGPVRGGTSKPVRDGASQVGDSAFLPLGLPFSVGRPIEVVHPRGYVIRVPAVFDSTVLGRILATIDASAGASGVS